MRSNVLVVDDEPAIRRSLSRLLRGSGYAVRVADSAATALERVRRDRPDVVLLDICLPDSSGLEILPRLRQLNENVVVIAMTAFATPEDAVLALKGGAYDYVRKPFNIDTVRLLVKQALGNLEDGAPVRTLTTPDTTPWKGSACERLVARSPGMRPVLDIIHRIPTRSRSNILIDGETGVGKELVAHAIHETSGSAAGPFIPVACGAIPKDLIESELFGHEPGAYTGARPEGRPGIFEKAGSGTVFLDEIGELDPGHQVKLLRVLESREFCRVGSLRTHALRARVVAATNRRLEEETRHGRFREDLYYRLNVVRITVPPLRERRSDILPLAESFLREFSTEFGRCFRKISAAAQDLFLAYRWPGNVRELRNVIERIVMLEFGETVCPEHLPGELHGARPHAGGSAFGEASDGDRDVEAGRRQIVSALEQTGGNVARGARLLGLERGALRYRMKKYGIESQCRGCPCPHKRCESSDSPESS